MSFLFPAAFFLALAVPAVVMLYLRRPQRVKREISSLLLWQRVLERAPRHRFLGKLRNPLSLLLALLIFLFLLLALAKPTPTRPVGKQHTVVVLDLRARMQAGDTFPAAASAAGQAVSGAGAHEEIAVLGAARWPRMISSFSEDPSDLRRKISLVHPTDGGGQLEEAIDLARKMLASRPGAKKVILITDRLAEIEGVDVIATGQSRENVGITSFAQRAVPASPQSADILIKMGNFSGIAKDIEFEILLDDRPIDLQTVHVEAGSQADTIVTLPGATLRNSEGRLTARLTAVDSLAVDDSGRTVFPTRKRPRILLLTNGNPYLESALLADTSIALEILAPDQWKPGMGSDFASVIWDNSLPTINNLKDLGAGSFFFFGKTPFPTGAEIAPSNMEATPSPLLWNVNLSGVQFFAARSMAIPPESSGHFQAVAQSGGEPLILAGESSEGQRIVATAFATAESNLPVRASFPLFISNIVHWLAGDNESRRHDLRAGEVFVPEKEIEISIAPIGVPDSSFTRKPLVLSRNGFYAVRGAETDFVAVSTHDTAESDLRSARSTANAAHSLVRWAALQPWQWLTILALGLLSVEWILYHRRVTE